MSGAIRVLAGPRLDTLRINLLDWFAIDQKFMRFARQVRTLAEDRPQTFRSADRSILWPQFMVAYSHLYPVRDQSNRPSLIGWRASLREPHNPFGLAPEQVGATGQMSGGEKIMVLNSIKDGPGRIEIRSPDHLVSRVHPVLMHLNSSWIWGFSDALSASLAAAQWWQAAGILSSSAQACLNEPTDHKVTRVDVCLDHECLGDQWKHEDAKPARWMTRSRAKGAQQLKTKVVDKSGLTIYIGQRGGGGVFTRIYDKTAELGETLSVASAPKVWATNGWDGKTQVWRCEFEFGSAVLQRLRRGELQGTSLQAVVAGDLWVDAIARLHHLEAGNSDTPSSRWMDLALACAQAQPYLRSQAERRRSELEIAMRQLAEVLDRCKAAGADGFMTQALVDERWTKDEDDCG
jgi:predicted transcriptional regulator